MAFNHKVNPTFNMNVSIPVPGDKPQPMSVTFRYQRKKELAAWLASAAEVGDAASLLAVVDSWDYQGGSVTIEAMDELLDSHPGAAAAIFRAYWNESTGGNK